MNTGAAIDVWRIFVGEEECLHAGSLIPHRQSDKWVQIVGGCGHFKVDARVDPNIWCQFAGHAEIECANPVNARFAAEVAEKLQVSFEAPGEAKAPQLRLIFLPLIKAPAHRL